MILSLIIWRKRLIICLRFYKTLSLYYKIRDEIWISELIRIDNSTNNIKNYSWTKISNVYVFVSFSLLIRDRPGYPAHRISGRISGKFRLKPDIRSVRIANFTIRLKSSRISGRISGIIRPDIRLSGRISGIFSKNRISGSGRITKIYYPVLSGSGHTKISFFAYP